MEVLESRCEFGVAQDGISTAVVHIDAQLDPRTAAAVRGQHGKFGGFGQTPNPKRHGMNGRFASPVKPAFDHRWLPNMLAVESPSDFQGRDLSPGDHVSDVGDSYPAIVLRRPFCLKLIKAGLGDLDDSVALLMELGREKQEPFVFDAKPAARLRNAAFAE